MCATPKTCRPHRPDLFQCFRDSTRLWGGAVPSILNRSAGASQGGIRDLLKKFFETFRLHQTSPNNDRARPQPPRSILAHRTSPTITI